MPKRFVSRLFDVYARTLTAANGSAFADARWEIDYVRVYTDKCVARKGMSGALSLHSHPPWIVAVITTMVLVLVAWHGYQEH